MKRKMALDAPEVEEKRGRISQNGDSPSSNQENGRTTHKVIHVEGICVACGWCNNLSEYHSILVISVRDLPVASGRPTVLPQRHLQRGGPVAERPPHLLLLPATPSQRTNQSLKIKF